MYLTIKIDIVLVLSGQAWECFTDFDEQAKYLFAVIAVAVSYVMSRCTPGNSEVGRSHVMPNGIRYGSIVGGELYCLYSHELVCGCIVYEGHITSSGAVRRYRSRVYITCVCVCVFGRTLAGTSI